MQELIATLVYGGGGEVEAVEALLILAEWVPRRPQSTPAVGRGEEDNSAWMFVGTAVRLGYLLGLDRTGFRNATDPQSAEFNRKRLAWSGMFNHCAVQHSNQKLTGNSLLHVRPTDLHSHRKGFLEQRTRPNDWTQRTRLPKPPFAHKHTGRLCSYLRSKSRAYPAIQQCSRCFIFL